MRAGGRGRGPRDLEGALTLHSHSYLQGTPEIRSLPWENPPASVPSREWAAVLPKASREEPGLT